MGELSIKIRIADRDYPMRVNPDEQDKVRLAGKLLNDKIKMFREQFGVEDKQDLMAMIAFDCLIEKISSTEENSDSGSTILTKISDLDKLISSVLSE